MEVKASRNCDEKTNSTEKNEVINKLPPKPTYQAENVTESSPPGFLDPDTANISERVKKTEDREREMFEEHEVKNQIQDKISSVMIDDSSFDGSQEEENLIIEDSSLNEIDSDNMTEDDSTASDEFFSEDVTTFEPFVTPVGTKNLTD